MSQQIDVSLPADLELSGSWTVEWDAVSPSTGATVAGVVISNANVVGTDTSPPTVAGEQPLGPFMLVPGPDA